MCYNVDNLNLIWYPTDIRNSRNIFKKYFSEFKLVYLNIYIGRRQWHPTPVLLPGKSHGWRSLVGCSPWGRWESDTTERLHLDFSLSCIGEGNGNPLQCSCLENPRDGGAWSAAVYGVAQSWTRLKWLSNSSSLSKMFVYILILEFHFYQKCGNNNGCSFFKKNSTMKVRQICIYVYI